MGLFLPQRWRRQPQGVVSANWNNDLTRLIDNCILISSVGAQNPFNPTLLPFGSPLLSGNPLGIGLDATSGATGTIQLPYASNKDWTKASFFGYGFVQNKIPYPGNNAPYILGARSFGVGKSNYNYDGENVGMGFVGSNLEYPGFNTFTAGILSGILNPGFSVSFGAVYSTGYRQCAFYANGKYLGYQQGGTWDTLTSPMRNPYDGGGMYMNCFTGNSMMFYASWSRVLSAAEFASLDENPWQIFKPTRPIFYSLPSSGSFQYSRPTTDILTGWTRVPASGTHSSAISETTSNQSDYLQATSPTLVDSFTMGQLQQPATGGLGINYDIDASARSTQIELLNGASVVKSVVVSGSLTVGKLPSIKRQTQPVTPVRFSSPLMRPTALWIPTSNGMVDTVGNAHAFTRAAGNFATMTPATSGYVLRSANPTSNSYQSGYETNAGAVDLFGGTEVTLFAVVTFAAAGLGSSSETGIIRTDQNSQITTAQLSLGVYPSTNRIRTLAAGMAWTVETDVYLPEAFVADTPYLIVGRIKQYEAVYAGAARIGGRWSGFVPNLQSSFTAGANINQTGAGCQTHIGGMAYQNAAWQGDVLMAGILPYSEKSDAVWQAITTNPWQLFKGPPKFFSLPGTSTTTTGTINVSSAELAGVSWPWTPTLRITSQ